MTLPNNESCIPELLMALLDGINEEAFESYRAGDSQLRVWRGSTPHNWWLQNKETGTAIAHWPEGGCAHTYLLAVSDKEPSEGPKVTYGGLGKLLLPRDEGKFVSETWQFNETKYLALLAQAAKIRKLQFLSMVADLRESELESIRERVPKGFALAETGLVEQGDFVWNYHRSVWGVADARNLGTLVGLYWAVARRLKKA